MFTEQYSHASEGPEQWQRWEEGWGENLECIQREGYRRELLRPRYYRDDVVRYRGAYIQPLEPGFEAGVAERIRRVIFHEYLAGYPSIVEFGCGTGSNVVELLELFPAARLCGCDWAKASQEILRLIARDTGKSLQAVHFNMFAPELSDPVALGSDTAVLTVHTLEQLGTNFRPMLEFLLDRAPGLCLHIEPIVELYDPELLLDSLSVAYHRRRNYLDGFLEALRLEEATGRIEIVTAQRVRFGSLFHEGYSIVAWRPV